MVAIKYVNEEILQDKDIEFYQYVKQVKKNKFLRRLNSLKRQLKGKRVVIYGAGTYFDAITSVHNLNEYFNICAVSDKRYETNDLKEYKGFKTISPFDIENIKPDAILCGTINPQDIHFSLIKRNIIPKNRLFVSFMAETKLEKFEELIKRNIDKVLYFLTSFDINKTKKYANYLSADEFEAKINYNLVLKRLKRKAKKSAIRVLFIVEESSKWGYQSVYDEMKKDSNFEVLPILCYPIITKQREEYTQKDTFDFFKKLNMEALIGFDEEKQEFINPFDLKPDIIFYQQPWYIKSFWLPKKLSKQALNCIVSYGYSSISAQSWGSVTVKKIYSTMWKMFVESPYHKKFYEKASKLKYKDIIEVTGYPKMDYYRLPVNPEFEKLWKDEDNKKPRIIWAPHHSIDSGGLEMSNFKDHYKFFYNLAHDNPQYSFVFKPHPFLRTKCITEHFMTENEFDSYMESWKNLENASVWDKGNYFDIFKTSDVLITDCSSFLGEYYLSEKPIIFLDKNSRCAFNEFGAKIKDTFYKPNSLDEIPAILKDLLINKNDYKKPERLKLIKEEYFFPEIGVGRTIVNYIKNELGIKK